MEQFKPVKLAARRPDVHEGISDESVQLQKLNSVLQAISDEDSRRKRPDKVDEVFDLEYDAEVL